MSKLLQRVSHQAATISWGTPAESAAPASRLIAALNDVAIAAGTVDAFTGAAKQSNPIATIIAA